MELSGNRSLRCRNFVVTIIGILFCLVPFLSLSTRAESIAPVVQVATVESSEVFEELRLSGTVNALRTSRLSPAVAGLIDKVEVEVGQRVNAGDLLFVLDQEQAVLALNAVNAQVREARALLQEAQRRLDEALSVGAGQNIAATEVGARRSQVVTAEAALAALDAEAELQRAIIRRHRITAPFEGLVTTRSKDLGEWVEPGDELATLIDHTHLRLDFLVPQDYFPRIGNASVILLPVKDQSNNGSVERVAEIVTQVAVTDPQARTFLIRSIPPDKSSLMPGMAIQAHLRIPLERQGLLIPRDALNRYPEGRITVWVAEPAEDPHFRVSERRIRIARGFGEQVVVLEGLTAGEKVVSRGNEALEAGMEVRIALRAQPDV